MKRTYYLFNPGRLSRKDNTLKFTPVDEEGQEGQPRYIPIETVDNLFVFGSLDTNSMMYNFLGKHQVAVHFFDYYADCPDEAPYPAGKTDGNCPKFYRWGSV